MAAPFPAVPGSAPGPAETLALPDTAADLHRAGIRAASPLLDGRFAGRNELLPAASRYRAFVVLTAIDLWLGPRRVRPALVKQGGGEEEPIARHIAREVGLERALLARR